MAHGKNLVDLYKRSVNTTIGDGTTTIEVTIVKLNDIESEELLRKANAARSRVLMFRDQPDSEIYQAVWGEVEEFAGDDVETLARYVTIQELAKRAESIEAELGGAEDSEWFKDDYLQGLRDSWEDGLKHRWAEDNEDPEAARVRSELERFVNEVNARVEEERDDLASVYESMPLEQLHDKAVKAFLKNRAEAAWWTEYRLHRAYLTTRTPEDHSVRHFAQRLDVDACDPRVRAHLFTKYESVAVDDREGKESPEIPTSSPSSELPDEEEISDSSGLVTAAQ